MGNSITEFINLLSTQIDRGIYVWGGNGGGISNDEIKLTRVHTSTGKCYIYMALNLDLDEDEIARYAGYYQFR